VPFVVLSSSLNPASRSRALARCAHEALGALGHSVEYIDVRDYDLPICDAATAYSDPNVLALQRQIAKSDGIVFATPVYNFAAASSAKNFVELTGSAWTEKVVGFLCAAGGRHSYMAVMGLVNSLMLDFRVHVIPRFVYSTETDFDADLQPAPDVAARVRELAETLAACSAALAGANATGRGEP
jgi:NAD(P)H-dependent FMN reductase